MIGNNKRNRESMEWNQIFTMGLATAGCKHCLGIGLRLLRGNKAIPCNCVLRTIFRACYRRFRQCANREKYMSQVSLVPCKGADCRRTYARQFEEYMADFQLVAFRHLNREEQKIFRYHFLLGADWRLCCERLKIDRGTFFHTVYRIQQRLGKVFYELEPHSLYPVDEYFVGRVQAPGEILPTPKAAARNRAIQPPLKKVA